MVAQSPTTVPFGREDERTLTAAVELARRLVRCRLAWLTLPTDNAGRLQLAATSEASGDDARGVARKSPVALPLRRGQRTGNALRVKPADGVPAPVALLRDEAGEGIGEPAPENDTHISVAVALDSGRFGRLHAAQPLDKYAFGDEERMALRAHANFIADHLALTAANRRIQELQGIVQQLQRTIIETQEEERGRIARDLHDETGHILTAAIIRLDIAERGLTPDSPTDAALQLAREGLVNCAESLHRSAFNLRPQMLEDLGLAAALHSLIDQARESSGLQIALIIEGRERRISDALELAVFRVLQEGLTNIRKHAGATAVQIRLNYAVRWLTLHITDDGIGIRRHTTGARVGAGLKGMRERMNSFGGTLIVGRRECGGTELAIKLPVRTHSRKGGR